MAAKEDGGVWEGMAYSVGSPQIRQGLDNVCSVALVRAVSVE